MKRIEKPKTWKKTRAPQVYQHVRTGIYYVRGYVNGKDVWRSLGTDVFSVAQPKAKDELADMYKHRKAESALVSGIATFGDAAHVYEERLKANPKIKPSTLDYRKKTIEALYRWWPALKETKLKLISDRACLDWARKFRAAYHPTRYNNTVDTLRHILGIGVERGAIYENPPVSQLLKPVGGNWSLIRDSVVTFLATRSINGGYARPRKSGNISCASFTLPTSSAMRKRTLLRACSGWNAGIPMSLL